MRRILVPAIGAFVTVLGVGLGLSYGLLELAKTSPACIDFAMIYCGLTILPLAGVVAIVAEITCAWYLLRQQNILHPLAISILATAGSIVFCYIPLRVLSDMTLFYFVFGLVLIMSFTFFDRYINRGPGRFYSKILRSIIGLGIVAIAGVLVHFFVLG